MALENKNKGKLLTLEEVAERARTSTGTVRYWMQCRRLRFTKPGKHRLVWEADLQKFLESCECK